MTDADWPVAVACLLSQSEEDQQLKSELEMLVERLKVRRCLQVLSCAPIPSLTTSFLRTSSCSTLVGVQLWPLHPGARVAPDAHSDVDELHDVGAQAPEVPEALLRYA